jgi:MoxR-like ATPase
VFTNDTPETATVADGVVRCNAFPVIVITSNGEREFPPAFLRRCLRLETQSPDADLLAKIVANHLVDADGKLRQKLIVEFVEQSRSRGLPIDKLLEAVYLATSGAYRDNDERWMHLRDTLWRQLTSMVP